MPMPKEGEAKPSWWDLRRIDYEWTSRLLERPYVVRERLAYLAIAANAGGFALVVNRTIDTLPLSMTEVASLVLLLFVLFAGVVGGAVALLEIANACAAFSNRLRRHLYEEALSGTYKDANDLGGIHSGRRSILGIMVAVISPLIALGLVYGNLPLLHLPGLSSTNITP